LIFTRLEKINPVQFVVTAADFREFVTPRDDTV
jgi:hypothetical protein